MLFRTPLPCLEVNLQTVLKDKEGIENKLALVTAFVDNVGGTQDEAVAGCFDSYYYVADQEVPYFRLDHHQGV